MLRLLLGLILVQCSLSALDDFEIFGGSGNTSGKSHHQQRAQGIDGASDIARTDYSPYSNFLLGIRYSQTSSGFLNWQKGFEISYYHSSISLPADRIIERLYNGTNLLGRQAISEGDRLRNDLGRGTFLLGFNPKLPLGFLHVEFGALIGLGLGQVTDKVTINLNGQNFANYLSVSIHVGLYFRLRYVVTDRLTVSGEYRYMEEAGARISTGNYENANTTQLSNLFLVSAGYRWNREEY